MAREHTMVTKNSADETLLRDWAESGSEAAFAEIVRRHVGLVFQVCRRELQDRSLTEDAVQAVFLVLAQKGKAMSSSANLLGWLFRTSRLVCKDLAKAERRRKHKEFLAGAACIEPTEDPGESLANTAVVNDALSALRQTEREAVLPRFYDQRSFQEVGEALDMSDDTAQKCVTRALEKMRRHLLRAGITLTSAALAAFLSTESARAVPPEILAKALLAASALPGGQIASVVVGTKAYQISQGVLHTMRLKMIVAASAVTVLVTCGILLASQIHEGPKLTMEKVRAHYAGASAFSMTIINHDSSNGNFTQLLDWRRGGKFTLKVISPGNKTIPDFSSNGPKVVAILPDGDRRATASRDLNDTSDRDVTGGLILSWLEDTPSGSFVFNPPSGAVLTWSFGPRTKWHGHKVKELVLHVVDSASGGSGNSESLFINQDTNEYIGLEWMDNAKPGYALYRDQKIEH